MCAGRVRTRNVCCPVRRGARPAAAALAARLRARLPAVFDAQGAWEACTLAWLSTAVAQLTACGRKQAWVGMNLTELLVPPGFEQPSELSGASGSSCAERGLRGSAVRAAGSRIDDALPARSTAQALSFKVASLTASMSVSLSWCVVLPLLQLLGRRAALLRMASTVPQKVTGPRAMHMPTRPTPRA